MNMPATATKICAALVALSACAPSVGSSQQEAGELAAHKDQGSVASQQSSTDTSVSDVSTSAGDSSESATGTVVRGTTGKTSGKSSVKGPRPADLPFDLPVPVESELAPVCAERGDEIDLEVTTEPGAAISYQAVYSDNGGGAAVPFGEGYGGNDKGYSNDDGAWTSSWVVGLNAPSGPARLDIVVGFEGEFGYDDPHFAVADENGNCPAAWLDREKDE